MARRVTVDVPPRCWSLMTPNDELKIPDPRPRSRQVEAGRGRDEYKGKVTGEKCAQYRRGESPEMVFRIARTVRH